MSFPTSAHSKKLKSACELLHLLAERQQKDGAHIVDQAVLGAAIDWITAVIAEAPDSSDTTAPDEEEQLSPKVEASLKEITDKIVKQHNEGLAKFDKGLAEIKADWMKRLPSMIDTAIREACPFPGLFDGTKAADTSTRIPSASSVSEAKKREFNHIPKR